jgi:hypothetical protein
MMSCKKKGRRKKEVFQLAEDVKNNKPENKEGRYSTGTGITAYVTSREKTRYIL